MFQNNDGQEVRNTDYLKRIIHLKFFAKSHMQMSFLREIEDCGICFEPLFDGRNVKTLPCTHKFHQDCVEDWFTVSSIGK